MITDNTKTSREIEKAHNNKRYIVSGHTVYQPFYSVNAGYYAMPVYRHNTLLVQHGRFFHLTGTEVNHVIGANLLREL